MLLNFTSDERRVDVRFINTFQQGGRYGSQSQGRVNQQECKGRADRLYKAMKGFGTKESAVYKELEGVRSQDEWGEVQGQFRTHYSSFHSGNLVRAIDDELTKSEMQKARDILSKKGIDMDGQGGQGQGGYSSNNNNSYGSGNNNNNNSYGGNSNNSGRYGSNNNNSYGSGNNNNSSSYGGGNSNNNNSPSQQGGSSSGPGSSRLNGFTDRLYKAMKGFGTDESAIYNVIGELQQQSEWDWVKGDFKKDYPKFHGGDVVKALKDDLTKKELTKVTDIMAQRGIQLEGGSNNSYGGGNNNNSGSYGGGNNNNNNSYGSNNNNNNNSSSSYGGGNSNNNNSPSQQGGNNEDAKWNKDSSSNNNNSTSQQSTAAAGRADRLYKAMKGFGTKEATIYQELESVRDEAEWRSTERDFKQKYASFHKGDLVAAIKDELTKKELQKASDILAAKGIQLDASQTQKQNDSTPSNQQSDSQRLNGYTDRLYKAMKGMGTNENAIYDVVGEINNASEWGFVVRDFKSDYASFHGGDVVVALKDELNKKELAKVTEILASKGVQLEDQSVFERLEGYSEKLYKAMKGFGTDEAAVYSVLEGVNTPAEWNYVKREFAENYPKFHKGDVIVALKDELNKKEEARCTEMMQAKGIRLFD